MCDMQQMPHTEDASCEDEAEMNFASFSAMGGGTHFVTAGGQVAKLQQNVAGNGGALQQVVGMVGGLDGNVQYVRAMDGSLQAAPHLISVPIALPGAKPGDPQQTVQIQVLSPNMLQAQQQPKYQMQIPIQGFQQGGAVLTLAYSPEDNNQGGIQLLGNSLPEGLQLVSMPQEMQLVQPSQTQEKEHPNIQHQVFITPNQQIIINTVEDGKVVNNNTSCNNNNNNSALGDIVIKQEFDDNMHDEVIAGFNGAEFVVKEEPCDISDDESSQGTEASDSASWQATSTGQADLIKYLNTLQPQQAQALPVSLQQFLKLNPSDSKKVEHIQIEVSTIPQPDDDKKDIVTEALMSEDGTIRIQNKKKKKYKKKPPKPARPKPGQVVIAQAADGTPIFCCPECQMAYPEKEQLEMHLIVHKIERRFICGICGAGLKRKEHLERHKLGHNPERPFVCGVCCKGFKRREHLTLHAVIHSGVKTELCGECGKGFYRKDHLRKHTRSHEHRRARDEASAPHPPHPPQADVDVKPVIPTSGNTILPEITIHVPTSNNMNMPVQINIPQHVVSSLAAAQQAQLQPHSDLDDLLAPHT